MGTAKRLIGLCILAVLVLGTGVLGAGVLAAGPAAAQQADEAPLPFEERLAAWEETLSQAETEVAESEVTEEAADRNSAPPSARRSRPWTPTSSRASC